MRKFPFILFILFISCTVKPDSNQLTLVLSGDPKNLDPAHATDVRSGQVTALLFDNLVHYGHGSEIIPGIAKSWEISEDGTIYNFLLKDSIFFQNGEKLNSLHIKSSFERILNPEIASRRSWLFENIIGANEYSTGKKDNVSGFDCINDSTFQITLIKPFAPFLGFLAMPSASIVLNKNNKLYGTGPWIQKEWVRDGHFLFESNPHYFDGQPNLDKLKIRILPEALPRVAEFITGYLDIMDIPNAEFELWQNDPEWKNDIQLINQLNTYYIGLNCSRPPFNDIKVRQAVNYAINVEEILTTIFAGRGQPAGGPIPPVLLERDFNPTYYFDPKRALKLLKKAGYNNGFEIELWQSQSKELFQITEIIQNQLKQIGINVKIIRNDWNMYSDAVRKGIPDMYYRSWWADYPDPENFLAPLFESEVSKKRWTRYENPNLDNMIEKLQTETNHQKRINIAQNANDILKEDAPWIYLWHMQSAIVTQHNLKNWSPSVMFNAEKYHKVAKHKP
jgi:oligopeptide transport system substrate-binding protein